MLKTEHSLVVPALVPGDSYRFQVSSSDPFGNVTADDVRIFAADPTDVLLESFDSALPGSDPAHWFDTGEFNALIQDDSVFKVFDIGGDSAIGTTSTATNVHTHLVGQGVENLRAYELTGRLRIDRADAGIGVTAFSQFPNSAAYYRIRRYGTGSFHLAPLGTTMTSGILDSGVVPDPDSWYRFRFRVEDAGIQTEIRAKIWSASTAEPIAWSIDAVDASATRLRSGTIGLWSFQAGGKFADDLSVTAVPFADAPVVLSLGVSGNGTASPAPDLSQYEFGQSVDLTAVSDPGWAFVGWTGDATGAVNPLTVSMYGDLAITAEFQPITSHPLILETRGDGTVSASPDLPLYDLGTVVTLTATPDPGWGFAGWSGDLSSVANPGDLSIIGDSEVLAHFFQQVTGLRAYWSFNDASGATAFDVVGGHHGAVVGGAPRVSGLSGGAIELDGVGDHVLVDPTALAPETWGGMTVAAWVKNDIGVGAGLQDIVTWWSWSGFPCSTCSFVLTHHRNDQYFFEIAGANVSGGAVSTDWTHVAGTYDGATIRLYVDGALVASAPRTGAIPFSTADLVIGAQDDGTGFFAGLIDDVRLYDWALGAADLSALILETQPSPDLTAPSQPSGVTLTVLEPTRVEFEWTSSIDPESGILRYDIYRDTVLIGDSPANTFADDTVSPLTSVRLRGRRGQRRGPSVHSVGRARRHNARGRSSADRAVGARDERYQPRGGLRRSRVGWNRRGSRELRHRSGCRGDGSHSRSRSANGDARHERSL